MIILRLHHVPLQALRGVGPGTKYQYVLVTRVHAKGGLLEREPVDN